MSVSAVPMPPTDPAMFVAGYEALRASFLVSRATPAARLGIQRMIAEGLNAWLTSQPTKAQRAPPAYSSLVTVEVPGNEDLVQLMASMTLRSLVFSEEAA